MADARDVLAELTASLDRQLSWIAAADNKVSPVFAINTAMLGITAALVPDAAQWTVGCAVVTAFACVLLLLSIGYLSHAAFPRLDGPKESMIFFGGIAKQSEARFVERALTGPIDEYLRDLASQVHRNAEVAATKYGAVKTAMILMFVAMPIWVFSVMMLYVNRP